MLTLTGVLSGISGTSYLARFDAYHSSENRSEKTLSFRFLFRGFWAYLSSMFVPIDITAAVIAAGDSSASHS